MIDFKFKGQRIGNKEWLCGDFLNMKGKSYIQCPTFEDKENINANASYSFYEVIPESVELIKGQNINEMKILQSILQLFGPFISQAEKYNYVNKLLMIDALQKLKIIYEPLGVGKWISKNGQKLFSHSSN